MRHASELYRRCQMHLGYISYHHGISEALTAGRQCVVMDSSISSPHRLVERALCALVEASVIGQVKVKVSANSTNFYATAKKQRDVSLSFDPSQMMTALLMVRLSVADSVHSVTRNLGFALQRTVRCNCICVL